LLVTLFVHAARADALIVESFRVPPAMAAQGLSGEVVASQVLDKLAEMQASTQSVRAASSYANNWGDELKIDIPNTGATADQIWKLLRSWLGKETRISGEVIQAAPGLALTARVGGTPGRRFESKTADLDSLVSQGAETIFRQTQPYRYGVYLMNSDPKRFDEGMNFIRQLTRDTSERERKWALSGLSWAHRNRGEFGQAALAAKRALAIDPAMEPALSNLAAAYESHGRDQAAVDAYHAARELPASKEYDARIKASNDCGDASSLAYAVRDPAALDRAAECLESANSEAPGTRFNALILRHDAEAMAAFRYRGQTGDPAAVVAAQNAEARLLAELERGNAPALVNALAQYRSAVALAFTDPVSGAYFKALAPAWQWPNEVAALVRLGRFDDASTLIANTASDCVPCLRSRGRIAEARGNLPEAQRWYAEAARQAPRLAPAFVDWGRLLVKGRRYDSAFVKLKEAARLAPNWADPLKYWGDALAAQGHRAEALSKYDAALKLAPKWRELEIARERVTPRAGTGSPA
jgi:tetratricopeptide (TPR) repeat protein